MLKKNKSIMMLFSLLIFFCLYSSAFSAVPMTINYQGKLTDMTGNAINGTQLVEFFLYNADVGGSILWSEQRSIQVEVVYFKLS